MRRQILVGILFLLFIQLRAQDQEGKDYYFGENFHFHGYGEDFTSPPKFLISVRLITVI